ncbi:Uncharacterised protein [Chryseobacterium carnipullorum]|uniref:Uncharacterized protein n=1 Tax=Chryseobacterium carnipullorum TaxID=1124835 RepID=A0A376EDP3_CHRCU|nr:Uncharacterised protein [Chryseobacterium carnipullorum]
MDYILATFLQQNKKRHSHFCKCLIFSGPTWARTRDHLIMRYVFLYLFYFIINTFIFITPNYQQLTSNLILLFYCYFLYL